MQAANDVLSDDVDGDVARESFDSLRLFRPLGTAVFILQFVGLASWSLFMYERFSGTQDEAFFFHVFFEISRGHFSFVHDLLKDHGSYLLLALTPIDWLGPPGLAILWAQDLAVVAAGFIAFRWILQFIERDTRRVLSLDARRWLLVTGIVLLVANPWIYWAISFDIHIETFAAPFAIAAAYDFYNQRFGRAWIWVAFVVLAGDVTSTWLAGLALSSVIAAVIPNQRRKKYLANAFALLGVLGIWTSFLHIERLGQESSLSTYYGSSAVSVANLEHGGAKSGFSSTALHFSSKVLHTIRTQLHNFYANLAPAGVIGIATTWTIGVPLVSFTEDALTSNFLFTQPFYQLFPLYSFIAVGTVVGLGWVFEKYRQRTVLILRIVLSFICINCIVWAVIFIPHLKGTWVLVSKSQAAVLAKFEARIPENDEVLVSQGVSARFANRAKFQILSNDSIQDLTSPSWFIVAPSVGIEDSVHLNDEIINSLNSLSGAKLISYQRGIYLYEWTSPHLTKTVTLGGNSKVISATSALGSSGVTVPAGKGDSRNVQSNGTKGYVVEGDYWDLGLGNYTAHVSLESHGPCVVEVWDSTAGSLIARNFLVPLPTMTRISIPFSVHHLVGQSPGYHGVGPFSFDPVPPRSGDEFEIRIWQSGGIDVTVSTLSVVTH